MKKIYFAHSTSFDFKNELYSPIRNSDLNTKYQFILPHETSDTLFNSKQLIKTFDYVFAEVSYPSTGLGIELGWADSFGIPIIAFYRVENKISSTIAGITELVFEYNDSMDLVLKMKKVLEI